MSYIFVYLAAGVLVASLCVMNERPHYNASAADVATFIVIVLFWGLFVPLALIILGTKSYIEFLSKPKVKE